MLKPIRDRHEPLAQPGYGHKTNNGPFSGIQDAGPGDTANAVWSHQASDVTAAPAVHRRHTAARPWSAGEPGRAGTRPRLVDPDPGVEQGVGEVDDQVGDDDEERGQDHEADHELAVALGDRGDRLLAEP